MSHFKVRVKSLIPGKPTSFDLFIRVNQQMLLYLRAGDQLDKTKLDSLSSKDSGQHFYVANADKQAFKSYVHNQILSSETNPKEKALILRESSLTLVEELYENPDVGQALSAARPIVDQFVRFMKAEPEGMSHLISLSGHDFYTYNHSLDVAIYSLGLGEALGFQPDELEELGAGSLFHDIGKRQVSLDILCKKGPLDENEWAQMQKHPQFGLILLNEQVGVSDAIKAACFEHHESFSGNGYPQNLSGQEIHPFARIVAIADTYDAMTTQRSYNVPLKPVDAVIMMKEKLAGRYDPQFLKAMYSVLFRLQAQAA